MLNNYLAELNTLYKQLGINQEAYQQRMLPLHPEAHELVDAEISPDGKTIQLTQATCIAWKKMKQAAEADQITLLLESGFRSIHFQAQLIQEQLTKGITIDAVLIRIAAPGYSEHHTGHALDITSPECYPTLSDFEQTKAFAWLEIHAVDHGFFLSYPPNNPYHIIYEPWHWFYRG